MKHLIKKVFTICFIILFLLFGILISFNIYRNHDISAFLSSPDETIVDNIPSSIKNIVLFPFHMWNYLLHKQYFFDDSTYITEDGNMIKGSFEEGNISFSISKIEELKKYADENNINFLYVILPGKPLYDEELTSNGVSCYRNKTADHFVKELKKKNVKYVDLRDEFRNSKTNAYDWFYKTDHHWNSDAGLQAARLIAIEINDSFNLGLDIKKLDKDKFKRTVYNDYWIGEMGKKIFGPAIKKESFIVNVPDYRTNLIFKDKFHNIEKKGDFSVLLDDDLLKNYDTKDNSLYYYYLYSNNIVDIVNLDNNNGNIMYIKDSFSNVVVPFLSLTSSKISVWDMRKNENIYSYLENHDDIDTLVVAYTISMIPKYDMNDFK